MRTYRANLVNDLGDVFDTIIEDSILRIKEWARYRGRAYYLHTFNNKLKIKTCYRIANTACVELYHESI